MGTTTDPEDPALRNIGPDGMQEKYLVLSDEERAKGFVRPVRRSYQHMVCHTITTMGQVIAETYARNPFYYGGTYCAGCREHFPVGETGYFVWVENGVPTDIKVGT